MSIDFWKLDGTRFSTLPDLVSYNGYLKDANGDVYETKANSAAITKKQFMYNVTVTNANWLSGSGNCVSNIAIGEDGSLTATKTNLDNRYFTEDEIRANYIPWDTRWDGTGGGFYRDGNVFINGNGYSDYLTNILTGIKNTINGLGSIYAKIGDCYTKNESNERYALRSSISNATVTIMQGGVYKGSFTLNGGGATINLDGGNTFGGEQTLYATRLLSVGELIGGSYLYSNSGGSGAPSGPQSGTWIVTSTPQQHHQYKSGSTTNACGQSSSTWTTVYSVRAKPMLM